MSEENEHIRYIKMELAIIEEHIRKYLHDTHTPQKEDERLLLVYAEKRVQNLHNYVAGMKTNGTEADFIKSCIDCGDGEANPGLDVCGPCYHQRIWGSD